MNEQLIVKNFGPIKDATVDFKRVTVFIGPTGGGKSTLAKLAAIMRGNTIDSESFKKNSKILNSFSIGNFIQDETYFSWLLENSQNKVNPDSKKAKQIKNINSNERSGNITLDVPPAPTPEDFEDLKARLIRNNFVINDWEAIKKIVSDALATHQREGIIPTSYLTSNRTFISAVEYSWAGLLRDDIGLPKDTLNFANDFSLSRKSVPELDIPFLNVKYLHRNGQDFIKVPGIETLFRLYETASGIQSVTPLLVLLEHLSRNTKQAQSFIIEEPELNLFPLAQFELVKILVDKCARTDGKNDLVLTTHSPYVLTALNLLCYAHRIAQQDEATAKKVAKLIPRHCWIDPNQFAAYYVDRPDTKRKQQVRSITNKKTGLIEENELDTASDELGSIFDKLVKLRKPTATAARAN